MLSVLSCSLEAATLAHGVLLCAADAYPAREACVAFVPENGPRPDAVPLSGTWVGPVQVIGGTWWCAALARDTAAMLVGEAELCEELDAGSIQGIALTGTVPGGAADA